MISRWTFSWRSSAVLYAVSLATTAAAALIFATTAHAHLFQGSESGHVHVSFKEIQNEETPELGRIVAVKEGDPVELTLTVDPASMSDLSVNYRIATFSRFQSHEGADYIDLLNGSLTIPAGEMAVKIAFFRIHSDNDVEPTRKFFEVLLDNGSGYAAFPLDRSTVHVTIKEGVCDRTPQVRDAIVSAFGVTDCADVVGDSPFRGNDNFSGITGTLDLSSTGIAALKAADDPLDAPDQGILGDFTGLNRLNVLKLDGNQLVTLPEGIFLDLERVTTLDLGRNRLEALRGGIFSGLDRLRELFLNGNRLTALPGNAFEGAGGRGNLTTLDLSHNRLETLPQGVFNQNHANLARLDLSHNRLGTLPRGVFSSAFFGLGFLKTFDLSNNRLTGLPNLNLESLKTLDLSSNRLETLPDNLRIETLESLDLSSNRLTVLPFRAGSGGLFGLSGLHRLILSSNRLTILDENVFSNFDSLETLKLDDNELITLPATVFSDLVSLVELDLRGNPGAPFAFARPRLESTSTLVPSMPGVAEVKLVVDEALPTTMAADLSAEGGTLSDSQAVIPGGSTESAIFTVTQDTGAPVSLRASTGTLTGSFFGVETAASELVVDVVGPSVSNVEIVSVAASGNVYLSSSGEVIRVAVGFDEAVDVSATTDGPSLTLTIGATRRTAAYTPGLSEPSTLVFTYELQADDADVDGISIEDNALMLAGAEITDLNGNRIANTGLGSHAIMDTAEHRVIRGFEISFDETDGLGPGRVVAGGDSRRVSVMLVDDLGEVEVRLSSDVPGGGLTIAPELFRLSAGNNVQQVELTAGARARGPLDADGAIGPAQLTVEMFLVNGGTPASMPLLSTATSVAVDVRFYVDISYTLSGARSTTLTLVVQHPDKGAGDVDVSLVSDNERWPSQLASGEIFEGRLVRESGPADDELFIDTFEIEEGRDVAIAIDATVVSPQSTLLGTSFWRTKWIGSRGVSYAPGYEPEVSSNLFQVNVVGPVRLSLEISSTRIQIEPGGSTQITLTTDPRLEPSEIVTVTLQAPAGSGVQFNGRETQRITLDEVNQTKEVTVSALGNARPGVHRITVEAAVPDGGLVFPSLPEMTVQAGALGIRLHDAQAAEGEVAEVRLTLDEPLPSPLTLNYRVDVSSVPGTDNADRGDFTDLNNGVVTVPAGESSTLIRVRIEDDEVLEPLRETFQVSLLDNNIPDGYAIVPVPAVVTIKEGVCDRTRQVRDAIVSAIGVGCADVDDLSGVSSLSVETPGVESLQDRDLAGLVGLRILSFSAGMESADLRNLSGSVFSDLGGLESLDFRRNKLGEGGLPSTVFQSLVNLRSLDLSDNQLSSLPATIFAGLVNLRRLDLSDNPGLSDPLACPPAGTSAGLPAGIFAGLDSLSTLVLHRTNVRFCLEFEQVSNPSPNDGVRAYRLSVALGAPYQFTLGLAAEGGSVSTESVTIAVGSTHSGTFTVTQAGNAPLRLTHGNKDAIEDAANGVFFDAASPVELDEFVPEVASLLFYSSPDADGVYNTGSEIKIAVLFDEAVRVTNMGDGLSLPLRVYRSGTINSFSVPYDAVATGVAHDADVADADNHELVFSRNVPRLVGVQEPFGESDVSFTRDALEVSVQATAITDVAGNPASLSLSGRDVSTRAYRLRFDPAALRTVAGSDEDERTLRTLHLEALSGSIRLPASDEITVALNLMPGDVGPDGVSVRTPDDDALLTDLTFTRAEPSRSIRVRVDGAANRVEGGGTAGGVTFVEASLSGHSRSSRGDEGLRVVPALLPVGVVPLEVAPTPDVQRFELRFNDAPSVVLDAGQTRSLMLGTSSLLPFGPWRWQMTVSYEGQDSVTASYPGSPTPFLQDVTLTVLQDARGEIGILTASARVVEVDTRFGGFIPVAGTEVTPAVIAVRVRPFQEFPAMRKYALAFTPDPLGVLVGEPKTVTLTLRDPDDASLNSLGSDRVDVTLGLRGGSGTVDPDSLTLSASTPKGVVTVTVDAADAFADVDRSLWLTAEAAPVEGLQVGAAQLAVTASQPTFELVFDPSRPLTVPRGGATRTTSLRLSEVEGVALPPIGTRLEVPVSLSLGGDGVHLTPSQAVLTAEVGAQGVTTEAVEVEVRAESTAPQQSLVLVAEPDQAERSVRLISAALPVNVTPPVRQFGFEFEGTGSHALGGGNPGFFFVPGVPLGYLGVSPDRRLFVRGTSSPPPHCGVITDQPGNPGGCAGLASGLFRLTGDELAEGERVTATLTWYISEAGSPGDLSALGSALFRPGFFNADRDLVPPGTTWMYMWSGEKLLTDIYSTQAEVVFTGPGRPSVPLDFGRLPVGGPSPLALRISVSDDQERALNAEFTDGSLGVAASFSGRNVEGGRDVVFVFSESERCLQPGESAQVELRLYSGSNEQGNPNITGCRITPRLSWGEDSGTSVISVAPPRPTLRPNDESENGWFLRAVQSLTITAAATATPGESLVLRALPPEFPLLSSGNHSCNAVYGRTAGGGGAMSVCIAPREFDLNFTPPQALVQRGTTLPAQVSLGRASLTGNERVTVALRVQGEANAGVVVSPSEVRLSRTETSAEFNVIVDAATATSSLAVVATVSGDQESALKANFNAGVLSLSLTDEVPPRRFDLRLAVSGEEDAASLRWDRETMVELSLVAENPLAPLTIGEEVEVTVSLDGPGLNVGAPGASPTTSIGVFLSGNQVSAPLSLSVARDEADQDDPARSRLLLASVSAQQQAVLNAVFTPANLEVEVVPYDLEDEPTRKFALEFTQTDESDAPPIERLSLLANGSGRVYLRLKHVAGTLLTRDESGRVADESGRVVIVDLMQSLGEGLRLSRSSVDFDFDTGFSPAIDVDVGVNASRQRVVLPARVPYETARRLGASVDSAFLVVEVSPLEPVTEVLQEREYTLRFDPPEVQVTAGSDVPAEVNLLLEGTDPLTLGESAALRLVPSDPALRVSPLKLSLGRLASSATVVINPRDVRNEQRRETLGVEPESSQIPGATFDIQPLMIEVLRREVAVSFVPAEVSLVRGGAAAPEASVQVSLRVDPELFGDEEIGVDLDGGSRGSLRVDPPSVILSSMSRTTTVTVIADSNSVSGEVTATTNVGTRVGDASVTFETLSVEVVRGVDLVISGLAGEETLVIIAGESTELRITTDPPLEAGESVVVSLSLGMGLELSTREVRLSGPGDVADVVTVTAVDPDLEGVVVSTTGIGAGVGVIAGDSVSVDTLNAAEFEIVFDPPLRVEVEQGRRSTFIVTTFPGLGQGQTITAEVRMEPSDSGDSGLSFGGGVTTRTIELSQSNGRADVSVTASATVAIGSTAAVVIAAATPTPSNLGVTSSSPLELVVTPPRVTVVFSPDQVLPLILANTGVSMASVTLGLHPDDRLQADQSAMFKVTVSGSGLSLGRNKDRFLEVSLSAVSPQATVVVEAAEDAEATGVLRVEALSGAVLREGTRTTLAVSVTQEVGLVFVPETLEIERGRSKTFRVTTTPALRAGRSVEVRLDTGAPGFDFGPGFGNGEDRERAQLLIALSTDNPSSIVEIRASTRVGVRSTLTATVSGEGVSAPPAELGLRSVPPRVSVSLTPFTGPSDNLMLTIGSSTQVRVGLSDYTLFDDQRVVVRLQTDGDDPPGLTVSPPEVVLSEAVQERSVVVTATTAAGRSENLTATATGDVLATPARLVVQVSRGVQSRGAQLRIRVFLEGALE